jgi:acyl-[acyl-carrier-protein]-phospholipid O-acyltransferase/long-chain-fatty-acid--[acyl-carrier-protein] ligase
VGGTAAAGESGDSDLQGLAMAVFGVPFLLFSGIAGYLSERYSKRTVIVLAKVAEIVVMAMGMLAFWIAPSQFWLVLIVLFLMGAQSAFFGPSKYGVLPEMLRQRDLSQANGIFLMTTFLAIIFGTALAGPVKDLLADRLYLGGLVCVAIAVVGTATSLLVRRLPAMSPDLKFTRSTLAIPKDVCQMLWADRPLLFALLASCMFWLVGGIVVSAVNALGVKQLVAGHPQEATWTSLMAGGVGLGIAIGSIVAGSASGGHVNFRIMRIGCWGIVICLAMIAVPGPGNANLLGYWGSLVCLILLGGFTGMFAVPLQVFLQMRPPAGQVGRTIAVMNQANWVAIVLSGGIYSLFVALSNALGWQPSVTFGLTALLMLPVALFYRPREDAPAPVATAGGLPLRRRAAQEVEAETSGPRVGT